MGGLRGQELGRALADAVAKRIEVGTPEAWDKFVAAGGASADQISPWSREVIRRIFAHAFARGAALSVREHTAAIADALELEGEMIAASKLRGALEMPSICVAQGMMPPGAKAGDEIHCTQCGKRHVLCPSKPPMVLYFRCGTATVIVGLAGPLTAENGLLRLDMKSDGSADGS